MCSVQRPRRSMRVHNKRLILPTQRRATTGKTLKPGVTGTHAFFATRTPAHAFIATRAVKIRQPIRTPSCTTSTTRHARASERWTSAEVEQNNKHLEIKITRRRTCRSVQAGPVLAVARRFALLAHLVPGHLRGSRPTPARPLPPRRGRSGRAWRAPAAARWARPRPAAGVRWGRRWGPRWLAK